MFGKVEYGHIEIKLCKGSSSCILMEFLSCSLLLLSPIYVIVFFIVSKLQNGVKFVIKINRL